MLSGNHESWSKWKKIPSKVKIPLSSLFDWVTLLGFTITILSVLAAILSGFGHRLGWWHFTTGLSILRWAAIGALASTIVMGRFSRSATTEVERILASSIWLGYHSTPLYWLPTARSVPPIHDITTDTENPPAFSALIPLRADAPNSS